ncbi:MAG TPA: hypothetical protein VJB14_05770, partial [Planctomycetota bacterium]|nr:hypothetical protein [Planctomycetota bacterium]
MMIAALTALVMAVQVQAETGPRGDVSSMAFSPDGRTLALDVHNRDASRRDLTLVSVDTGKVLATWEGVGGPATFSRDGRILSAARVKDVEGVRLYEVNSWDLETRNHRGTFELEAGVQGNFNVEFSRDGRTLAAQFGEHRPAIVWDLAERRELRRFDRLPHYEECVRLTPDGRRLLTSNRRLDSGKAGVGEVWTATLWDVATGEKVRAFRGVGDLAFSPDGRTLAWGSGSESRSVLVLWDPSTGKEVRRFTAGLSAVAFSQDGKTLASSGGGRV